MSTTTEEKNKLSRRQLKAIPFLVGSPTHILPLPIGDLHLRGRIIFSAGYPACAQAKNYRQKNTRPSIKVFAVFTQSSPFPITKLRCSLLYYGIIRFDGHICAEPSDNLSGNHVIVIVLHH